MEIQQTREPVTMIFQSGTGKVFNIDQGTISIGSGVIIAINGMLFKNESNVGSFNVDENGMYLNLHKGEDIVAAATDIKAYIKAAEESVGK